eukprot:gene7885-62513_t
MLQRGTPWADGGTACCSGARRGPTVARHAAAGHAVGRRWHGMLQRGTPWADGAAAINACPVAAGTYFDYVFTANPEPGTYFYHGQ